MRPGIRVLPARAITRADAAVIGPSDTSQISPSSTRRRPGGLAEASVGASQMGSTFTWIFQEQLDRLQEGDRFYYFNQLKDAALILADINSQHFSDIVARNTGLDDLHYAIFKVAERVDLDPH